jgi:hypothetical protein
VIQFGLRVGLLNEELALNGLGDLPSYVAEHLATGSGGVIQITPKPYVAVKASGPGEPVSMLRLHESLARVIGNTGKLPVTDLGLLLAHSYEPEEGVFGVMFDVGFPQSASIYTSVPRQGCAVFLGAIKRARSSASDYRKQVRFSSVHEMGHVFNLVHQYSPLSFMAPSPASEPHEDGAFFFGPGQSEWLARCAVDPKVMPGGSPFRDLDFYDEDRQATQAKVKIRAELTHDTFWNFEPVLLNVSLEPAGTTRMVKVPAEIDPGYKSFRIVIREPNGRIRLYRAPFRFCPRRDKLTITRNAPFCRDIPIFGEAGGYTFQKAGRHQLWVEFDLTSRRTVRSDACTFELLGPDRSAAFDAQRAVLNARQSAKTLFYREGSATGVKSLVNSLEALEGIRPQTIAMTKYICGRAACKAGKRSWGREQLEEFLSHGSQPEHQVLRAERALAQRETAHD